PAFLASPMVLRLRGQEADLLRRQAELAEAQAGHDQLAAVGAALAETRRALAAEAQRVIASEESQLAAAKQREATMTGYIDTLRREVSEQLRAQVRLAELQREADADRSLLETFLIRAKETAGQNAFEEPDARVISPADLPVRPSWPRVGTTVAAA